jgi:hypothetical protein
MAQESNKAKEPQPAKMESENQADPTSVQTTELPMESATGSPTGPEDAPAAGGKDGLQRRVLNLNVDGGQAQRQPDTPAGQHATGSFTDEASKKVPKDAS